MAEKYPRIFVFIYQKLKEKSRGRIILSRSQVVEVIRRNFLRLSHSLHEEIIKDLEDFKIIKKLNKRKYELTGEKLDKLLNKYNFPFNF